MSEALKHVNRTITPILTKNSISSETSMHPLLQLKGLFAFVIYNRFTDEMCHFNLHKATDLRWRS